LKKQTPTKFSFFFPVSKYIDMPSTLLTYSFLYLVKIHERSTILLGDMYKSQTCGRQCFYNEVSKEKDAISDSLLEGCHSISLMWCRFQFLKLVKIM
jgi:hypothetical protein